jgi:hypothetical protein
MSDIALQNATSATAGPEFTEELISCLSGLDPGADLTQLLVQNLAAGVLQV